MEHELVAESRHPKTPLRLNSDPEWSCISCGGSGPIPRKGLRCRRCAVRAWRAGQRTYQHGNIDRVFWTRGRVVESGCAEWTGSRQTKGPYGVYARSGRKFLAHRHAWELAYGPIPAGMKVLHRCDNPPCIQPSHLFLGTTNDNNQDRLAKSRYAHGEAHAEAKLTTTQVLELRSKYPATRIATLAREYGVGWSTVYGIVKRKAWAWLP